MSQDLVVYQKCQQCGGTGIYQFPGIGGGEMPCPWPGCNGTGYYPIGQLTLDPGLSDLAVTLPRPANHFYTYEIIEATEVADYNALSDANKTRYRMIIAAGVVDLSSGTKVRQSLMNMFNGTDTYDNLVALVTG